MSDENHITYFAKTNFRNGMQKFGIKKDDRRRHMYVIGKTGMGKTTLLENMVLADIYAGHGCCYIDPHGDTAEKLIDYIPEWRLKDVVYFNPSDMEFPMGFNILESVDPTMKHLVAAGMMGVFKKIWENVWSARMEYILNNTILALLDNPGTTLLDINRMLSDKEYRSKLIDNVQDPIVKQFWIKEFGAYQDKFATEAVAPIQNKVGQFLSATIVRNIVAQPTSTLRPREIMDSQKIFIVNLSKGRIGEDASRLLGGMLITKIQMAAMERVDMPESERKDFYLYVDEFQNFAVESFASILSEARKYRLVLIMAHQYIAQLTEEVRDAVFGNVGSIVSFRVGSPDAMFMEAEFFPRFTPEDLINLPKYHIYLKLMIDGVTSQPFSAVTLPPIAQRTHSTDKVIQIGREQFGGKRAEIEKMVATWSGFGDEVDLDEKRKEIRDEKKQAKKEKYGHEYECTRCSKKFKLPVELDRSRPIYCEECMPIIQREREEAKKKGGQKKQHREEKKKVVEKPPKVTEGELVVKEPKQEEVSLDALSNQKTKEQPAERSKQQKDRQEPQKRPEVQEPKPEPTESKPEPTPTESKPDSDQTKSNSKETGESKTAESDTNEQPTKKRRRRRRKRRSKKTASEGGASNGGSQQLTPGKKVTFE